MQNNKRLIIIVSLVVLTAGLVLWLTLRGGPNPSEESYEYVDKDTGETISVQPGVTPEGVGDNAEVTVIGLTSLANYGSASLSDVQLPVFRKDLAEKAVEKLGDHDQIIKVVKPSLNPQTVNFEAELIYKENTEPAKLIFDIPDNYVFSYEVFVNGKLVYKSGQLVASGAPPPEYH